MSEKAGRGWWQRISDLAYWWFQGLFNKRSWFAGLRLLGTGIIIGLISGYVTVRVYRQLLVEERYLPKPVIAPAPGLAWVQVLTTGYCPCALCCGVFSDGRTAINRSVETYPFGIAVEPKLIPYRSLVDVPGYGLAMVDDTGGAMRQSATKAIVHFDLRFQTHTQARAWGRRWMWVALPADGPAARLPVRENAPK
jgi:3D (Asp-Asp-Asp) domain-containing protein